MAETISETMACSKCGAEVRPGSAFCYNCGGRVALKVLEPVQDEKTKVEEKVTQPAPGLRSAGDLRRRERPAEREPRRIKWEPAGASSDLQLIVVTIAVLIFTVVIVALAFYLR